MVDNEEELLNELDEEVINDLTELEDDKIADITTQPVETEVEFNKNYMKKKYGHSINTLIEDMVMRKLSVVATKTMYLDLSAMNDVVNILLNKLGNDCLKEKFKENYENKVTALRDFRNELNDVTFFFFTLEKMSGKTFSDCVDYFEESNKCKEIRKKYINLIANSYIVFEFAGILLNQFPDLMARRLPPQYILNAIGYYDPKIYQYFSNELRSAMMQSSEFEKLKKESIENVKGQHVQN